MTGVLEEEGSNLLLQLAIARCLNSILSLNPMPSALNRIQIMVCTVKYMCVLLYLQSFSVMSDASLCCSIEFHYH